MIDLARLIYIGVTLLRFTERETWKKTPYQIITLFRIHRQFNPDRFKPDPGPLGEGDELDRML